MLKFAGLASTALTGILFAMAGFSYALATRAGGADTAGVVAARAVEPLHFTNPNVADNSGDWDLGDAVAGSAFTARFVRAGGGVPPYAFATPPAASNPLSVIRPELTLLGNGQLLAANGQLSSAPGPIRFAVQVTDSESGLPQVVQGNFRITLVSTTQFRFAASNLSSGTAGRSYMDRVTVLNGATSSAAGITFSADTIAGPSGSTLESNGLTLCARDGSVFGKPIAVGLISFVVHAADANGTKAVSRDGTREGQPISIAVATRSLSSDILSTAMTVNAGTTTGKDTILYTGQVNLEGNAPSAFIGKNVVLRIANYISPAAVLGTKVKSATAPAGTGPTTVATLSTKGQLKIAVSNETLAAFISNTGGLQGVTVSITDPNANIGNSPFASILGSEILYFTPSRVGTVGAYMLNYSLTAAVVNNAPGGNFMLTNATSRDASKNTPLADSDAWKVSYISSPSQGNTLSLGLATVSIGAFTDTSAVTVGNFQKNGEPAPPVTGFGASDPHVLKMTLSDRGSGSLTTGLLPGENSDNSSPAPNTGIPTAAIAGKGKRVPFSVNISLAQTSNNTIEMASSIQIFAKGTAWSTKNPSK